MNGKFTTCNKNNNADKAIVPQPAELLDYIENNELFLNTAGERLIKKYSK